MTVLEHFLTKLYHLSNRELTSIDRYGKLAKNLTCQIKKQMPLLMNCAKEKG